MGTVPAAAGHDVILRWFAYDHLPAAQQDVSRHFADLVDTLDALLPACPERTVAWRKLLEAKDAAVRASLWETVP
jgi:hypothetical protein